MTLTQWGLVMSFGDIDLGQHWLRQWLVTWRHQAITWTNVDLISKSSGIHLRAISYEIPQPPFPEVSLKITNLKLNWNLPGANELSLVVARLWCFRTWSIQWSVAADAMAPSIAWPSHGIVCKINSLAPGRFDSSLRLVNFKLVSMINILSIFCEIVIRWMPQHLTDH